MKEKQLIKKARKLGYITLDEMHRELMKKKGFRDAYEASRFEHAVISAMIQARITHKLTQAQVAKKAGMKQSAVARFETGNESPTLETTSRILAAVGAKIRIS